MGKALGNNGGRTYSFLNRPVWVDCNFTVDNTNGLGITGLKGNGIRNVFMHTATTPTANRGYTNPNPAAGYAIIQLDNNYNRYCGGFQAFQSPLTGSNLAINGSALTAGLPYVITAVGHATAGAVTIAPVADVSGSLASTWFSLYDAYGNTFIIWFKVSGVGTAPSSALGTLVQQSITTGDSAATIGGLLATTIAGLPIAPGSGTFSFTTAGTTTVTCTSTATNPYGPVAGVPADGTVATGFTFAQTKFKTNLQNWQNVGVPKGVTPAVDVSFIATATGDSTGGGSTGTVKLATVSGIGPVEIIGNPNASIARMPMGGTPHTGGFIIVQFLSASVSAVTSALTMNSYTPAGTNNSATPPIFTGTPAVLTGTIVNSGGVATNAVTAPAAGSLVYMGFYVEEGSILINGE